MCGARRLCLPAMRLPVTWGMRPRLSTGDAGSLVPIKTLICRARME